MSNIADWHAEEDLARKQLKKKDPNHPALKRFYHSTYVAVEAYWKALRELDSDKALSRNNTRTS